MIAAMIVAIVFEALVFEFTIEEMMVMSLLGNMKQQAQEHEIIMEVGMLNKGFTPCKVLALTDKIINNITIIEFYI